MVDLGVDVRIIWIHLAQDSDQCRSLVNIVQKPLVS